MPNGEVKISILVLDDDNDDLYIITRIIEEMGITNYQMYNDSEVFMQAINTGAHVCIIDHFLTKVTGLDILYQIKERNKDSFVIGYSGIEDIDVIINYLNGSLDRFVRKERNANIKLQKAISEGFEEVEHRVRKTRAYEFFRKERDKFFANEQRTI